MGLRPRDSARGPDRSRLIARVLEVVAARRSIVVPPFQILLPILASVRGYPVNPRGQRRLAAKSVYFFEDGHNELFNLKDDIGERYNLSGKKPQIADTLQKELLKWLQGVQAQMPEPNPQFRETK